MIAWWAKNPVAANLLMVAIFVGGLLAFFQMEREIWPTTKPNWVQINLSWPGAAPQEMEEQVIVRIEEALTDLDNVESIRSTAGEGWGNVTVEGDASLDFAQFLNDVKSRVDGVNNLPRDLYPPTVRQVVWRNEMIRLGVHGNVPERVLTRTAREVRDALALQPGVTIVETFGARGEEVSIELSEEAMRAYGLTFDEVSRAIRSSSINRSSGRVRTNVGDVQLRARNLADTREEFEEIVVRQTADGAVIRLKDVATVVDGFVDVNLLASLNGEPAVLVQVMSTDRMNVTRTSASVKSFMEEYEDDLPEGVGLTLWWDEADVFEDRMSLIGSSAMLGLLLVFIVLLLFLRTSVALWVSVGIATAFAGAFVFLPAVGVSFNMLSTFAFLLVIGVVVDDAIVVGESIHQKNEEGHKGVDAAILGAQFVAKPVIFAVLTTIIAFAPWMFFSGEGVQVLQSISWVVTLALAFSLIEALLILPAHLAHLKPRESHGWFARQQDKLGDSLVWLAQNIYRPAAVAALRHRYTTASAFFGLFVISVALIGTGWVKTGFMPEVENDMIWVSVDLPEGTPYARSLQILTQLQEAERQLEEETSDVADGEEAKLVQNWYTRAREGNVVAAVQLASPEVRTMSAKETANRLRELIGEIPDAQEVSVGYTMNDGGSEISFRINSNDMDVLRAATEDLKAQLRAYDTTFNVTDSLRAATDEARFVLKPGAEQLGLTLAEISRQVRQAYYGEEVQRLPREGQDVRVMLRYPEEAREDLQSLENFRVRTADGREVPLMAVADIRYEPGIRRIDRRERQRSAVVRAELSAESRGDIMRDLNENFFPAWEERYPGVSRGAIGQAEGQARFMQEAMSLYAMALLGMYALIAVAFGSYSLPLLIMLAIPFGFMGAVYGHLIFGMPLVLFSYFGVGAAAGVVVNDNLVLIDQVKRNRTAGMSAFDALVEAGVRRFRPILLTTVTTFIGLMPMMAEKATQAEFLKPTVVALAFGVAFALFVTLFLVPAVYAIGVDVKRGTVNRSRWLKSLWSGKKRERLEGFGSRNEGGPRQPAE